MPYFKPKGWVRYSRHVDDFESIENWCVAYHGTMEKNAIPILLRGLKKPGEEGVEIAQLLLSVACS